MSIGFRIAESIVARGIETLEGKKKPTLHIMCGWGSLFLELLLVVNLACGVFFCCSKLLFR